MLLQWPATFLGIVLFTEQALSPLVPGTEASCRGGSRKLWDWNIFLRNTWLFLARQEMSASLKRVHPHIMPPEPCLILPYSLYVLPRHPGVWKMLAVAMCLALLGCLQAQELQEHVSIILLGATGDLAKKYLWQGLFQLYLDEAGKGHSFSFHGTALTDTEQGQEVVAKVLKSLSCPKDVAPGRCAELKDQFQRLSQYRQLKTTEDYLSLSKDIEALVQHKGLREAGRIFYLSVPPFAYADIARSVNSSCRPGPGAWLRVVLEKPFGHDYLSAQQLAAELGSFFQEEEMYRVDHYLGKQVSLPGLEQAGRRSTPWTGPHHQLWN